MPLFSQFKNSINRPIRFQYNQFFLNSYVNQNSIQLYTSKIDGLEILFFEVELDQSVHINHSTLDYHYTSLPHESGRLVIGYHEIGGISRIGVPLVGHSLAGPTKEPILASFVKQIFIVIQFLNNYPSRKDRTKRAQRRTNSGNSVFKEVRPCFLPICRKMEFGAILPEISPSKIFILLLRDIITIYSLKMF